MSLLCIFCLVYRINNRARIQKKHLITGVWIGWQWSRRFIGIWYINHLESVAQYHLRTQITWSHFWHFSSHSATVSAIRCLGWMMITLTFHVDVFASPTGLCQRQRLPLVACRTICAKSATELYEYLQTCSAMPYFMYGACILQVIVATLRSCKSVRSERGIVYWQV